MKTKRIRPYPHYCSLACLILAAGLLAFQAAIYADTIYVSNIGDNTIRIVTPTGVSSLFADNGANYPGGLAFDTSGNLFAGSFYGGRITKFSPAGVAEAFANVAEGMEGLAFDRAGNLYAANLLNNTIERFTPGGVRSLFATASAGLIGPMGLAFDSAGNLYVGNFYDNNIIKFSAEGVPSVFASAGLDGPVGLACDSADNLYVANLNGASIQKFTSDGIGSRFGTGQYSLASPEGLAFDSAGNLYVASYYYNSILKFTPDGAGSVFASSGLNKPSFIAIVPEPSACALLGIGIPLLLVLRSRIVSSAKDRLCSPPQPRGP